MTEHRTAPPLASLGTRSDREDQMFGTAFDGRVLRRFLVYLRHYKRRIALALATVLAFTATQLSIPLVIRFAIDRALLEGGGDRTLLTLTVAVFAIVIALNFGANFAQEYIIGHVSERVLRDMRRAMFDHLQRVSLSFMDRTQVGRLMSRLQGDVGALQEFLETSVFAFGDLVLLIGITVVLLWLDLKLGALTLSVVPSLLIVRLIWLPRARKAFMEARRTAAIVNGALAENINGVRTVQAMLREPVNFRLFDGKATYNLRAHLRSSKLAQIMVPIVDLLTGGAMGIVIVIGGTLVLGDALDLGVMVAFLFYVQRFFDPIRSLTIQYSVMQRAMASGQRIFEVLDVPIDISDKPGAIELDECDGSIEFRNVTFGYRPDEPVLRDINLRIEPGQTVAVVGPTGSGKTSLAALTRRFYDVWDGQVLIGGHDVRDVTLDSLGRHIAMVLQDPFLFTGTIFDNIRYRSAGATRADVEAAARAVGAHDFISALRDGYHTRLEQRGANLSLGQRQLLSFARAIVADAKILVLDEATASVDSFTEAQIRRALKRLLEGRTGVVIAHRLATVRGADRIIVLQDGAIVETGDHAGLMKSGGLYARLYALNIASFDDVTTMDEAPALAYDIPRSASA